MDNYKYSNRSFGYSAEQEKYNKVITNKDLIEIQQILKNMSDNFEKINRSAQTIKTLSKAL